MNRSEAKDLLPIIQAFAEGKTIELRIKDGEEQDEYGEWERTDAPIFDTCRYEYRIKPEPKYRPFKNMEECWGEMQKHQPFGWVKYKDDKYLITEVSETLVKIGKNYLFQQAKEVFTFDDGMPFGIKVKE